SEHVINLVILAAKLNVFEPRGRPLGTVLLKEGPVIDAVRPSHQSQRPAFDMTKNGRRDFEVVLDQLGFDYLLRREEDLIEVREFDLALADGGCCACAGHRELTADWR